MQMTTEAGRPQVKLVRGPLLRLAAHQDHCEDPDAFLALCRRLRDERPSTLLAADLFSGAGGMSLGLEQAGMRVVFGADHDAEALQTHSHHFGGLSVGWDLGDVATVKKVGEMLRVARIDVLAGGPPCQPFSKAGRSGMRYLVREGLREPDDRRRDLWRSFLEIVRIAEPRAVVMENVPDMALDREMFILRSIVLTLEQLGYSVSERVVDAWRYGVPQFRQRLILVAFRGGSDFVWPPEASKKVTLGNAISDLPAVDGGWRPAGGAAGWREYERPRTEFQRSMRDTVDDDDRHRIFDHITRPVREDDLAAFELLDTKTRYSDLPSELKRYRDDIFDDKYKRLDADQLSRTITAHIAKDGYWYIHPEQNRTLTVREAARLQTFPDRFRFAGTPTAAFRQIGNAVPPRLGQAIGIAVRRILEEGSTPATTSRSTGRALSEYFNHEQAETRPWLHRASRLQVVVGEILLGRQTKENIRSLWPEISQWRTARTMLDVEDRVIAVGEILGAEVECSLLLDLARALELETPDGRALHDSALSDLIARGLIPRTVAELAMLVDSEGEEPVIATAGALRVAGRFLHGHERWLSNRNSNGRIAVGRLIGYDDNSREAHLGLIELGATICTPKRPACGMCPLVRTCRWAADNEVRP